MQWNGGDPRNASKLFPRVHRTFSNLKTWLQGTHHGVRPKPIMQAARGNP